MRPLALDGCLFTTQFATYPIDWWLSRRIRLKAHVPQNFFVPRGTLVLANHRSLFDPFLVTYHLGPQNWLSSVPLRYPTTPDYARRPILGRAIAMLGAYDIGKTPVEKAKKLLYTRDLLDRSRTVLLFPEGKIVAEGHLVAEFQRGVNMLFARDYPTVFVRLSGFNTSAFLKPQEDLDAHIYFSTVMRGSPAEKIAAMETFFDDATPWLSR